MKVEGSRGLHVLDDRRGGWTVETRVAMDTFITIAIARDDDGAIAARQRAFAWFEIVERVCNRFDPASELSKASQLVGRPFRASAILFELVTFAINLARTTRGAFDPTLGRVMESRGFNVETRSGLVIASGEPSPLASYRDIVLDPAARTIMVNRPLTLDLNAVAKGFAVDLAALELRSVSSGSIDAGGDLSCWGVNPDGGRWRVGVLHPTQLGEILGTLEIAQGAVCTSGSFERSGRAGSHLIQAVRAAGPELASVTVIGPNALVADGLATSAFILGPRRGKRLLLDAGVQGIFVLDDLSVQTTPGITGFSR